VVPTASAHEGEQIFSSWGDKGLAHYGTLDVPAQVLPLRRRDDAFREDVVGRLDDASLVFFSGGNPARLADALRATPFWRALSAAVEDGLPFGGCSAGIAFLTERTYDSDALELDSVWRPGLGFVRDALFGPHWDQVDTWMEGASDFIVGSVADGEVFVGLDEETAMVGDGRSWSVLGRRRVHVLRGGSWTTYEPGLGFELRLSLDGRG
jgi:cyanophycinase